METVVSMRELRKSYGGKPAVAGVSFEVARGETFGLLGANGAGKTTTLECLLGVRTPDSGSATILGMDPQAQRRELFERVGVQFQEARYQDKITADELCRETRAPYRNSPWTPRVLGPLCEGALVPACCGLARPQLGEARGGAVAGLARLLRQLVEGSADLFDVRDAKEEVLFARSGVLEPCRVDGVGPQLGRDDVLDALIALYLPELRHVELRPFGGFFADPAFRRG